MLNGLKKFTSAVIALVIAFTVVGAFSRLNSIQVNADTTTTAQTQLTLSGKVRQKSYGNKNGTFKNGVLTLGKKGKGKDVYSVTINFKNNTQYEGGIRYRVYLKSKGWTGWSQSGYKAGTTGKKYRIEAIRIELTGELAEHYSVIYSAYVQTYKGKQSWVSDGATAGTQGEKKRLEQIQVKIVPREKMGEQPTVAYRMYRDKYKWSPKWSRNGEVCGVTSGSYQKHEGLAMTVVGSKYTGKIEYRARGAGYSWMTWNTNNGITGRAATGKRMEEIQIRLTGELAEHFDVYYRTCVKSKGWLGWAKNGESAGTEKYDYYIMALQCVVVPKGSEEPGNLKNVKSKYSSSYLVNGNPTLKFADFKAQYKKSNTILGIDVSKYQGDIDFKKVKAAGCDFVILRCYVRNNYYDKTKKKYVWCNAPDTKFEQNYKNARAAGLKVGVYFFTCDYTEDNMRKYTRDMIAKCLKGKTLDFPIAFDWENFDYYKRAHKSKGWSTTTMNKNIDADLNKMLAVFEEEVEKAGYTASIYGSKSRLEGTWSPSIKAMNAGKNHLSIWMAHWVTKSSYKGSYYMWQVNSHGKINGISGEVDLDVAYTDRLPSPTFPVQGDSGNTSNPPAGKAQTPDETTTVPEETTTVPDESTSETDESVTDPTDETTPTESSVPSETTDPDEGNGGDEGNATPDDGVTDPSEGNENPDETVPSESSSESQKPEETTVPEETKPTEGSTKPEETVGETEAPKETTAKETAPAKETEKPNEPAKEEVTAPATTTTAPKETKEEKKKDEDNDKTPAKPAPSKEQPEEAKTEEPK